MKTQATSCPNRETLEGFLATSLDQSQTDRTEQHLSTCADCQERLVKLSAGADMWSEARSLLSDQDAPLTDEPLRPIDESLIATILGPTDDPHMLGRIGTYEICGIIGHGGTGIVFKAFDAKLNRFVAIKVLSPTLARNASARARFGREGQAIAAVSHDHVVPVYAVDEFRGIPYLVMQYVPGQSLQQRINEQGPLQPKQTVRIGMQVAQALACAHAQGVIHRDVKPANVLLVNGIEKVQVGDFGLAQVADDASMTRSGMIAGTPQYMSPEQTLGEPLDGRSDLFSLGSVMYAMCTGHPPFRAETVMGVIHRIANKDARPIRQVNPDTPVWLEQFVARLLQKSPDDRFTSADEVASYLSQELASMQQPQESATTDRDWQTKGKRKASYFPGAWLLLPCAILLLAFVVQAVKGRKDSSPAAAAKTPPTASQSGQVDEVAGLPPAQAEKPETTAVFNNNRQAQIKSPNDAALTLELLELTHSVDKASVAASYYLGVRDLKTQKGEQLFALRGLGAGFTMVDSKDSKLFPKSRFRFRLFIPSFENQRHSSFLARNTIRMPLAFDELEAVALGNRYVFAVVLPNAEKDGTFASEFDIPKGDAIERFDYKTGTSQKSWYEDLKKSNDIICVVEVTRLGGDPKVSEKAIGGEKTGFVAQTLLASEMNPINEKVIDNTNMQGAENDVLVLKSDDFLEGVLRELKGTVNLATLRQNFKADLDFDPDWALTPNYRVNLVLRYEARDPDAAKKTLDMIVKRLQERIRRIQLLELNEDVRQIVVVQPTRVLRRRKTFPPVPVASETNQSPPKTDRLSRDDCVQQLAGSWQLESEAQYGSVQAERDQTAESPGVTLSFKDETLTGVFDQPWKPITWKIEFDNVKNPQAMYLTDEDSGKKMSLRFRFVREYLEVCFSRRHPDRLPTKFGTAKHVDSVVWRLSRLQPIPPTAEKPSTPSDTPENAAPKPSKKQNQVSFFGIDDKGKKVVYLVDRSGSTVGDHFSRTRAELRTSLQSLPADHRFQVVLFNETVTPLSIPKSDSTDGMHRSSDELVSSAIRILRSHRPDGGTYPKPALVAGLANLKPDVIYMVTDGGEPKLSRSDLDALKRLNAKQTRIHCIELGEGSLLSSPTWLQTLAQENGGQYKYVDIIRKPGR